MLPGLGTAEKTKTMTHKRKRPGNVKKPEFKFRKPAKEGLELIRTLRLQRRPVHPFQFRIHLRRQKSYQQIEDINSQSVRDHVKKALDIINPQNIYSRRSKRAKPAKPSPNRVRR
jgi:hypothetical protein